MKKIYYLVLCFLVLACSKGDRTDSLTPEPEEEINEENNESSENENFAPTVPSLVFPEKDQLCLKQEITFNWSEAVDPEGGPLTYQMQISTNRAFTEFVENQVLDETSIMLVMEDGQDYYWRVLAIDEQGVKGDFSNSSAFYVEGIPIINHIPFNPSLYSPKQNSTVNSENVILEWDTSDLDGDLLSYDIYLGADTPPELYETGRNSKSIELSLEPNQTYYWQIHVSDGQSTSIGDIWSFRTN
ncbi:hypothetical protein GGR42_003120 [Saonia flava]|uniref:Fibronectin type-III domain-containing protein n=1 Tax=Saonia flava TaxID=523696 RepID=A0A846R782_9FLAO|nr:hypothetical protein [Saonia flava]NJB72629.1 hypothetical protein [Saonia flava]